MRRGSVASPEGGVLRWSRARGCAHYPGSKPDFPQARLYPTCVPPLTSLRAAFSRRCGFLIIQMGKSPTGG